jgi:RNA polymerase sigma-70 factor, ECF subfamily
MNSSQCRSERVSSGPRVETSSERDCVLICAVAAGDRAALKEIHSRYSPRIRSFALKFTRRRDLADEITCETLATIWRSAAQFRNASKVSTWIFGIAHILSIRALRKVGAAASIPADSQVEEGHDPWANDELCEWLDAALALLPEEQRTALELCYRLGYSCQQIADSVGCPLNTVKTRMFHGRRKLRHLLPRLAAGRNL